MGLFDPLSGVALSMAQGYFSSSTLPQDQALSQHLGPCRYLPQALGTPHTASAAYWQDRAPVQPVYTRARMDRLAIPGHWAQATGSASVTSL